MERKTVALIFGGEGREHDISVMGADFIAGELEKADLSVLKVLIRKNGEWCISQSRIASCKDMDGGKAELMPTYPIRLGGECGFLTDTKITPVSAALPLLHGELGEDGVVQGALRCAGIPCIGCDTVCGALGIDKAFTKLVASDAGIPVARGIYSSEHEDKASFARRAEKEIGYPMFIKPTRLGSSIGAGIAHTPSELDTALDTALEAGGGRVIAEELLSPVRELECGVMCINGKFLFTNIGEISCKGGFYDYDNKYADGSTASVCTHASISEADRALIISYARIIAERLGVRGLSRIDFLKCGERIYFNEINTMPGMTAVSMFPLLAEQAGMPMHKLLAALVNEL